MSYHAFSNVKKFVQLVVGDKIRTFWWKVTCCHPQLPYILGYRLNQCQYQHRFSWDCHCRYESWSFLTLMLRLKSFDTQSGGTAAETAHGKDILKYAEDEMCRMLFLKVEMQSRRHSHAETHGRLYDIYIKIHVR